MGDLPYPPAFDRAVTITLREEGGARLANHKFDPGGKTKYGISQKSYPHLNISLLTEAEAIDIYFRDYWLPLHLGLIHSPYVAAEIFDTAVNCGVGTSARIAQRAVNMLSLGQELKEDGKMGPATIAALNELSRKHELPLVVCLNLNQGIRYVEIVKSNPKDFKHFIKGWMKRLAPPKELLT
jgi:lysozyme family protein